MGWLDNKLKVIGEGSVEEAHAALNELLDRLEPAIAIIENRAGGILHGLLDRVKINISIEPIEKAKLANEP